MSRRKIQHRLRRVYRQTLARLRVMRMGTQRPLELIGIMLGGAEIQLTVTILLMTLTVGTLGYMVIEGWSFINAFYMTVITLTTVGYGEVEPLSSTGRVFSVIIILCGVTILAYGVSSTVEYLVTGKALRKLAERRQHRLMQSLKNHFIVAGFGRVGREVALNFAQESIPFVVVDNDQAALEEARNLDYLVVDGSATEDDVLREAGIERARGVVAAAGKDATNVYVVLTARGLKDNLFIVARATDTSSESKLLRAGADRVTSPYILSGRRMASLALRPHVVEFLDLTSKSNILDQSLEEVIVEPESLIANKSIAEIDLRRRGGANILAIYDAGNNFISNPPATTILAPGTRLILLGTSDQMAVTEALAHSFAEPANQPSDEE